MNFDLIKCLKNKVRPWWYFNWIGILCTDKLRESCHLWSVGCSDLFIHVLKKLISAASYVLGVTKVLACCRPWPLSSQSLFWTLFQKSLMHRWELTCGHRVAASGSLLIKTWWGLETPVPTSPSECWSPGPSSTISAKPPGAALPWVCVQVETFWGPAEWLSTGGIGNKKSRRKSWRSLLTGSSGERTESPVAHFLLPPRSLARHQRNCCQQSQEDSQTLCSGRCSWEGSPDPAVSLTPNLGLQAAVTSSLLMGESTTPAEMLPQLLLPTTLLRRLSLKHSLGPFAHIPSQGLNIHPPALSAIASFLFPQILAPSTSLPSRPISSILYSRTVRPASLLPTVHLLHSLWQIVTRGRRGGTQGLTDG